MFARVSMGDSMPSDAWPAGEEYYRQLFGNMSEGVALHRLLFQDGMPADYLVEDVNPAYESILGLPREHAVGRAATEVYGTAAAPYLDIFSHVVSTGEPTHFESYFAPMDRHFSISVFPVSEELFGTVFSDITSAVRTRRLSSALDRIGHALMSSLDFDELMRLALCEAVASLDAFSAAFLLLDGDTWIVRDVCGLPEELRGAHFPADEAGTSLAAVGSKRPIFVEDATRDPRANPDLFRNLGVASYIAIPVIAQDDILGVFRVSFGSPSSFAQEDLDFAAALSASLSLAVENSRRFEALREVAELNEALTRIDASINSVPDVVETMQQVVDEAAAALKCESAVLDFRDGDEWVIAIVSGFPEEALEERFSDSDVPFAALAVETRSPVVIENAFEDERVDAEIQRRYNVRSVMVAPIVLREDVVGMLFFNYHSAFVSFSEAQVDFARKLGVSLGLAYENARHHELEHHIAETLQSTLLVMPAEVAGIEFGYLYKSATEAAKIGGDFFDVFEIEPGVVGLVVGDVSGKGVRATSLSVLAKNTIKALAYQGLGPDEVTARTSRIVLKESEAERFVALFFGILNVESGHLRYVRAGLPEALLITGRGRARELREMSPVAGAVGDVSYVAGDIQLDAESVLLLCTDGVTEARDAKGRFFGHGRLLKAIHIAEAPKDIPGAVFDAVAAFTGGTFSDDMALLTLRRPNDSDTST